MSILDEVLSKEYDRMKKMGVAIKKELDSPPKGYVSKKTIRGKQYNYLQMRQAGKVSANSFSKKRRDN